MPKEGHNLWKIILSINNLHNKETTMPLTKGKSNKTFQKNLKTELAAGKPKKQALAISYAEARAGKKRDKKISQTMKKDKKTK